MSATLVNPSPAPPTPETGLESGIHTDRQCIHCRLPVPASRAPWARSGFCCAGCEAAYRLITAAGLGAYYEFARERKLVPATDAHRHDRFRWFDDPDFLSKYAHRPSPERYSVCLALSGVHCAACVWLLEKLPLLVPGVLSSRVSWAKSTIDLEFDSRVTTLGTIAAAINNLGYAPFPLFVDELGDHRRSESRRQLIRIAVAGAAAGNNMLIAAALYLGLFSGMAESTEQLLRVFSALIGVVSLVWPGRVFLTGAISALRSRTPHMDLPLALGLTVGTIGGLFNAVRGSGDIYFDSISVLIFVLLVGRQLQARQQRSAAAAIDLLSRLTPRWAHRYTGDKFVDVPADLLRKDDHVLVRAGEMIPADGNICSDGGWVDESILSGESTAIEKRTGAAVFAGSQNLESNLELTVTAVGPETRIGQVAHLVESAARRKPQIVQWADRIGGRFVVAILAIAVATLVFWLWKQPAVAADRAVALLIVACPCALAMATPLAIAVALAHAAKRKILIKGGDVLQRLSGRGMVWLDKTGTLTKGQMRLTHWFGDSSLQPIVAAVQAHSAHPIAVTMSRDLNDLAPSTARLPQVRSVKQSTAGGICGQSGIRTIHIGNRRYMERASVEQLDRFCVEIDQLLSLGITPVYVAMDGRLVALAGVGDPLREDAAWSLTEIRRLGWKVGVLSGDHQEIVAGVAKQLSIPPELARGELLPEEKLRMIQLDGERQTVVMVGDGVNDSAALAAASVGVAVRGGAEASLTAAPVYFAQDGLRDLVRLVQLSRTTMRTIRWNIVASLGYNIAVVGLAASGLITPLLAAILMPLSSMTVVSISLLMPRDWRMEVRNS